jgi:hypothetical protein
VKTDARKCLHDGHSEIFVDILMSGYREAVH